MDEKTKELLAERAANRDKIDDLKDANWKLTCAMCDIEGSCPQCRNWHYPHCGGQQQ